MMEIEYEKPREERLREWTVETERVNAALRAKGVEPFYTCSFEHGIFIENRRNG